MNGCPSLLTATNWHGLQFLGMASLREVLKKLADVARDTWIWVRQPPDDPVVRARTAFKRIETRGHIPGLRLLHADIRGVLKNREVVIEALRVLKDDEEVLVYALIADTAFERLVSGQHHVSRGRLSSQGRLMLSAYKLAARRLVEFGVYDRTAYEAGAAFLRQEIANRG